MQPQSYNKTNTQNLSASQENILANSIRNARQIACRKQIQLQHNLSQSLSHNTYNRENKKKQLTSVAQAMKYLHQRISQLEAFNSQLTKQNTHIKKQLNLTKQTLETYTEQYENHQQDSQEIIQSIKQKKQLIKTQQTTIKHLYCQIQEKQKFIKKLDEQIGEIKERNNKLEGQHAEHNKRIDTYQKLIARQIKQLQQEKACNKQLRAKVKCVREKSKESFPTIIESPQVSIRQQQSQKLTNSQRNRNRSTIAAYRNQMPQGNILFTIQQEPYISSSINKSNRSSKKKQKQLRNDGHLTMITELREQIIRMKDKNHYLSELLKESNRRHEQQMLIRNRLQSKILEFQKIINSVFQEINLLPNTHQQKFKAWIIKFKKIQGQSMTGQRSIDKITIREKSASRSRQSRNKSHSKSKLKPLKMEDLNISEEYSCYSRSHSKSKSGCQYHGRSKSRYLKSSHSSNRKQLRSNSKDKIKYERNKHTIEENIRKNRKNLSLNQLNQGLIKNCKKIHEIQAKLQQFHKDETEVQILRKQLSILYEKNQKLQKNSEKDGILRKNPLSQI